MNLSEIDKKQFLGKGNMSKCYILEDGNVLKLFNCPRDVSEIERFKYFLKYSNNSFLFPFEFIYDSRKFYGYITKKAMGKTLSETFFKSNLLKLSKDSYKLERDMDFVSSGGIVLYDLHDDNVLYDGEKYSVIDFDESGISSDIQYASNANRRYHNILIGNLFLENLYKIKSSQIIIDKINKYKFMSIRPSEMIVQVKNDIEKYYNEDIDVLDDINNIIRR